MDLLKSSAFYPVRIEAGLGNPPKLFTTNASESLNAVIKSKVNYEKSELGKFIDKMRSLTIDQQQEVERAVCCRGKYKLRPQYKFLEVSQQRWFAMTPEARNKHMAKVNSATLISSDSITDFFDSESNATSEGIDFPTVSPIDAVPHSLSVSLST